MSIVKRKAGSKDIVKSVLEFDAVPTEGSHNLLESGAVAKAIGNLGQPLQWKGPATVAQINAGITGIQPGWTYTLTDAGTLTDGSIDVEAGDEVAWTEDEEWFKVGGDSGKIAVFYVDYDMGQKVYPNPNEILAAIDAGKFVVIDEPNQGVWEHTFWLLQRASRGSYDNIYFEWKDRILVAVGDNTVDTPVWTWFEKDIGFAKTEAIAPEYDSTSTYAVGDYCMYRGQLYVCITAISTAEVWTAAHWTETSVMAQKATIGPNGVFIGPRKIHPGSKLFVEGLPVDAVDYTLVDKYNAFIYNRITAFADSGTVTLGLWNYDLKTYVSEQQLSTDSDNPTVIDVSAANASDTMEIHLKGAGVIDHITGSIT